MSYHVPLQSWTLSNKKPNNTKYHCYYWRPLTKVKTLQIKSTLFLITKISYSMTFFPSRRVLYIFAMERIHLFTWSRIPSKDEYLVYEWYVNSIEPILRLPRINNLGTCLRGPPKIREYYYYIRNIQGFMRDINNNLILFSEDARIN